MWSSVNRWSAEREISNIKTGACGMWAQVATLAPQPGAGCAPDDVRSPRSGAPPTWSCMALHLRRGRLSSERGSDMNRTVGIVLMILGLIGIVLAFLVFNGLGGLGAGHN